MRENVLKALFCVILLLCMIACAKTVYVPKVSKEVVRDTLVKVEPDSAMVQALLECDSTGQVLMRELSVQKGKNATTELEVKDNTLTSSAKWQTQVIERIVEKHDTTTVVEIREVIREVKHIPTIYRWCMWIAIAVVGAGVVKGLLWLKGF